MWNVLLEGKAAGICIVIAMFEFECSQKEHVGNTMGEMSGYCSLMQ